MSEFDESGRSIREENVIARIESNGFTVESDGRFEIATLTGLIRLAHLVKETGLTGRRQLRVGIHLHLSMAIEQKRK
jgi:hypothetical protein